MKIETSETETTASSNEVSVLVVKMYVYWILICSDFRILDNEMNTGC